MVDKQPAILEALANVQAEIGTVPKNGHMDFNRTNYNYVKADDLLEKLYELFNANSIIVRPEILEYSYETRDIGQNRVLPMVVIKLRQTYTSAVDGSTYEVITWGEGAGNDDKGLRKAVTSAQKIANLLTFSIATGEPEGDDYAGSTQAQPSSTGPARNEQQISTARAQKPADSPESKVLAARRKLKSVAAKKNVAAATLNEMGLKTPKKAEYFTDLASLEQLIADVEALPEASE